MAEGRLPTFKMTAWLTPRATWPATILLSLLPSFVADALRPDHKPAKPSRLHPTSYLDGLRGLAALVVFICHYTEDHHPYLVPAYGLNPEKERSAFVQLPFLRIIYSGRPMVHIFFVISGFVLSYKPLKAVHAGEIDRCHAILASSAFRRPIRLYGPCVVSTFLILLLIQSGWLYSPLPNFGRQITDWWFALFHAVTWPWSWDYDLRPPYDIHLWTIPIEFVHSMLLLMVMLALSPVRRSLRLAIVIGLMAYFLACGRWAAFEFVGGFFLAEVQLIRSSCHSGLAKPHETLPEKRSSIRAFLRVGFYLTLILPAWFTGCWPNREAERTPGIRTLLAHTPYPYTRMDVLAPQKFWFSISAMLIVWSFGQLNAVRRVLETGMSQYLGRISYAVYLVHGPVLNTLTPYIIGSASTRAVGSPGTLEYKPAMEASGIKGLTGVDSPNQWMLAWLVGIFMLGPVVIWVADVFWRYVDIPIILAAKRLEDLCLEK